MAIERTLSIIKPNVVQKNVIGQVVSRFENADLHIIASKMIKLDKEKAEGFYAEHKGKQFFEALIAFMTSGPIIVQILEGENAISKNREVMGATNYKDAKPGTIRADFADSYNENAVHGSDSTASAEREINYFFTKSEICPR